MLKKAELQQQELEWVSIEALVPEKHLLRKVDSKVDFGFIRDRILNSRPNQPDLRASSRVGFGNGGNPL